MTSERDFEQLARDLDRLESVTEQWSAEQKATVQAIRSTVEGIQVGAFRRLIRIIKEQPGGLEALQAALDDDWVRGVLAFNGLIRPPEPTLEERVEEALESVRPMLASHGGNVELVEVPSESEVRIRLHGSCDGCTHSDVTVRQGIETAIMEAVPTVERVKVVSGKSGGSLVQLPGITESPFAAAWHEAGPVADFAEGVLRAVELSDTSVLLFLSDGEPKAYRNACSHLGMPLDDGTLERGVITCAYHGFQFSAETGECLTAPEVQLPGYPVKVEAGQVWVQISS